MTHASVFSGIGGPEVAATMLGWENLFHCEINPFGRKVLDYWYPNSKSYEDITQTDFTEWRGRVDVLTGGFPCQPFSYAGQRRGAQDDRYLWPYMFRCIDQVRPDWVVAENVAGITTMVEQGEVSRVANSASLFDAFDDLRGRYELRETFTLQRICTDLESHGYAVQPVLVPACAVGAPHRRDRVFIVARRLVADSEHVRPQHDAGRGKQTADTETKSGGGQDVLSEQIQRIATISKGKPTTATEPIADTDSVGRSEGRSETDGREHDSIRAQVFGIAEGQGRQRNVADTENGEADTRDGYASDSSWHRLERLLQREEHGDARGQGQIAQDITDHIRSVSPDYGRWQAFPSVSPVHRGNDGLPFDVDRLTLPWVKWRPNDANRKRGNFSKWRTEALKAYGNAIVPQVMYEIFRAIEEVEQNLFDDV